MAAKPQIAARRTHVGFASSSDVWFAYVGDVMLRDARGVGRRFKSEAAAIRAAENFAAITAGILANTPA